MINALLLCTPNSMDSLITLTSFKPFTFLSFSNSNSLNPISFSLFKFKKTTKKASLAINSLNPQNPNSIWINHTSSIKPFSFLFPYFKKIKEFAVKSLKKEWEPNFTVKETIFLQNGAFGTALMSVTANAKVKISPFVDTLAKNPTFVSGFCALAAAQCMKVLLNFCVEKKWDFRIMFGSGGMPSSHSALCTALTTSVGICHGVADSLFPVCLGFSLIVMYDAIGVRRHAGMQAEVLNLIIEDLFQGHPISQRKLKELLGHTPLQVFAGALLGILVAWMCCQGCLSPL